MKRLKIARASSTDEYIINTASRYLAVLLKSRYPVERRAYCGGIQALMDGHPLSDWFSLYVCCIFDQIYQATPIDRKAFLDAVSNLRLNKLSMEHHGIPGRLELRRTSTYSFFYTNINIVRESDVLITTKLNRWKTIYSQAEGDHLGRFLLVSKIVLSLERMDYLPEKTIKTMLEKMSKDKESVNIIVDIVPLLLELQSIAPDEQAGIAMLILDRVIDATLKLLGFSGDNQALVLVIRNDLFNQKYLSFDDAKPNKQYLNESEVTSFLSAVGISK